MGVNKSFIILSKLDENLCEPGATGYCKIETTDSKSKVTIHTQGLKKLTQDEYFEVYFGMYDKNNVVPVYLGNLTESGTARELTVNIDARDVVDSKMPITRFNMILICCFNKANKNLQVPLVGYINISKQENWKNSLLSYFHNKLSTTEIKSHEAKIISTEEIEESSKNGQNEEVIFEKDAKVASITEPESRRIKLPFIENIINNKKTDAYDYITYIKQGNFKKANDYLNNIKGVHSCNPFDKVKLKYKWWNISDFSFFDNIFAISPTTHYIFYHPLINKIINTERYCLFGMASDVNEKIRYLSYGFPATYSFTDQLFFGGFSNFYPIKGHGKFSGQNGYWVVHVRLDDDSIIMTV